ncbi:PSD1 and planctomycete cytochrome C domain-containing protein [Aquisphaera insulae]|uniref:PSD1 and planctomycete cytochrome C domain-containing protein n=1 Tax=Aquisphaera insulae TaxID=2712864 RepID=UPI0013EA86F1|nr:PSD1 and planctomycete cytochrome C domain-containing protein [Aquisphaera insulae]
MPTRSAFSLLLFLVFVQSTRGDSSVGYQRDVQPILAEHCTACHGVDEAERKGRLRLDRREEALKGGDSGVAAIVPGKPDESEIIRRITSDDSTERMPPKRHNPLTSKQVDILKKWIRDGAEYQSHWAFIAPRKGTIPKTDRANPIDAFVVSRLKERNLALSAVAAPAALFRRLSLDLIGLPPSPADLARFQQDGFAATVERLLKSERFGEKWARHWLDAARYSDTNGYEKDMPREQWMWRDWVIDALNRDMPYDRFLIEQLAGDLLPGATQQQIVATGFLRNSMINEEGAIVPEQFRMVEMFDRVDCLGKSVMGLTTQCAQCHSHKFDPLTQDEYYGLFAFLNDSYEAQSWVYTPEQQRQISQIQGRIRDAERRLREQRPQLEREISAWEQELLKGQPAWEPLIASEMGSISGLNHPTQEADKSILMKGHPSDEVFFVATPTLSGVTGLRLEALNHRDLPHAGPGRSRLGTWGINELEAYVKTPAGKNWEKIKLKNATADFSEAEQKSADGKKISGPVAHLIDGKDNTIWTADRGVGLRNQPAAAVVQFDHTLNLPPGTQLKIALRMTDMLGCCRLSLTRQPAPSAPPVDHAAILAMQTPAQARTSDQKAAIFAAWRMVAAGAGPINDEIAASWKDFPQAATSILHLAEREPANHRETHLLARGNWDQPTRVVQPHTPAAFPPFPPDAPRNRLGLARWLTDPRSPLTARVAVNRIWQSIFGVGLVETAEDFGTRAPVPEYRELLDWLAVDFMEHGWSQKHLIRTIVNSDTYQQSSRASAALVESDPRNQWLARGPSFRADAEVVRDIALSVSGLITHRLGGPSIIPPVPQNVLDYNFTYPAYWKPAEGPERYRRTIYGFRKRSMPDPAMSTLDAPNGDFACVRRMRSNTPLAALTTLNEPIFVESARALALRILREGGRDDVRRADYGFFLCTSRPPTNEERDVVLDLVRSQRGRLADGWLNVREVATGDSTRLPELPTGTTPQDAAAWTVAARVLLNLDETISKR